eukprot:m.147868 g.147868  ORF g.147868 m.147868 type:complete len:57 (-) comp10110_c0_seq2:30-200(-)
MAGIILAAVFQFLLNGTALSSEMITAIPIVAVSTYLHAVYPATTAPARKPESKKSK